jgi:hypothetical protein
MTPVRFTPIERLVIRESDGAEFRFGFFTGALLVGALAFFIACWLVGHHVVVFL